MGCAGTAAAVVLVQKLGGEPAADAALQRMRAAATATCAELVAAVEAFKVDAEDFVDSGGAEDFEVDAKEIEDPGGAQDFKVDVEMTDSRDRELFNSLEADIRECIACRS